MGAGGSGANPLRAHRRAEPFWVGRGPAPAARRLHRNRVGPLGRRLAAALLSLRRRQHRRQPLGFLPAQPSQERSRPARRGDRAAPGRLIRAGVSAAKPGLRTRGGLLVRGPAARRALRPAGDGRAAAGWPGAGDLPPGIWPGQFEIPCAPARWPRRRRQGRRLREVIREVARRLGYRASFAPMADPGGVGNGVHMHMSLVDPEAVTPGLYDAGRPGSLSQTGARFAAGILEHLPALCALTAPSVISYLRLGPHHWSAGFGDMARATGRRPSVSRRSWVSRAATPRASSTWSSAPPTRQPARTWRSPCLVLAGLRGISEGLPEAHLMDGDPSELERGNCRTSGREAPAQLRSRRPCGPWKPTRSCDPGSPTDLLDCYIGVKRTEISLLEGLSPEEACERYLRAY